MDRIDSMRSRFAMIAAVIVLTSACEYQSAPRQVEARNPTVSYKYHGDDDLIQANQMAANYCSRYQSVAQPAQFSSDHEGNRVVVFECVAARGPAPYGAVDGPYGRSDMTYTYRTDQELMDDSREAQSYCMRYGAAGVSSNIINNHDGSKTVTFQCRGA